MQLDVLFAFTVGVLAGLTILGALALVIVWEWCAIRHTLQTYQRQPSHQERVRGDCILVLPACGP
jgi:hypothetical protein